MKVLRSVRGEVKEKVSNDSIKIITFSNHQRLLQLRNHHVLSSANSKIHGRKRSTCPQTYSFGEWRWLAYFKYITISSTARSIKVLVYDELLRLNDVFVGYLQKERVRRLLRW